MKKMFFLLILTAGVSLSVYSQRIYNNTFCPVSVVINCYTNACINTSSITYVVPPLTVMGYAACPANPIIAKITYQAPCGVNAVQIGNAFNCLGLPPAVPLPFQPQCNCSGTGAPSTAFFSSNQDVTINP
jgi:hypothetical protein